MSDSVKTSSRADTAATKPTIAVTIHPNTGIDLIARPTARNAPARVRFAVVPAVAAAVFAPLAAVSNVSVTAACPVATAFCSFAVVFNCVAPASAVSATVAFATIPAHHSLRPLSVTS